MPETEWIDIELPDCEETTKPPACILLSMAEWEAVQKRIKHLQASLDDYDNRITWFTTCQQCANLLDKSYQDYERIKELTAALTALVDLKDNVKESNPAEYERRKPLAWEAAREAIASGQIVPMEAEGRV